MKKIILFLALAYFLGIPAAQAGSVQYIGTGCAAPKVKVSFSRNKGATWEHKEIKPGQTFSVPRDATHLRIDNVPLDPRRNYKVKDGNVF